MEGTSIIIPVHNKIETTLNCINHIRKFNTGDLYHIIVVDNNSKDETEEVLSRDSSITYIKNETNLGLPRAYNGAVKEARFGIYCFMHNDVFLYETNWTDKLLNFITNTPEAGVVGLYGAKKIRRDGSMRGKSIIHSKMDSPTIKRFSEKVAMVDGLLLSISKAAYEKSGGFNEDLFFHHYDKDISLRAITSGLTNYVLSIPFKHIGASTRMNISDDDKIRMESKEQFMEIWKDILPVDVSTRWEKFKYSFGFK